MLITGFTAEHMQELANENVVGGSIGDDGHLMLEKRDGTQIDAGYFGLAAKVITEATDFDTLTTPGTYLFLTNTIVTNSLNRPDNPIAGFTTGYAGYMIVEGNGTSFVKQSYTNYNNSSEHLLRSRYNMAAWFAWVPPMEAATMTQQGIVELATAAEVGAQTDDTRAVTPLGLASMLGYRYGSTVVFTASGTFNKASYPGLRGVRVRVVGGGGGGGRANNAITDKHSSGSGGGGGGYAEVFVTAANLGANETVTVGAGGVGGNTTVAQGGDAGTSSFGTKAVATGGGGGGIASNQTVLVAALPYGSPGIGTTGEVKAAGSPGGIGFGYATLGIGGHGGSSILGGGGEGGFTAAGSGNASGSPGYAYGGGGGGASGNTAAPGINGSAGAPGVVIVEVYY